MSLGLAPAGIIFFLLGVLAGWFTHYLYVAKYPGKAVKETLAQTQ